VPTIMYFEGFRFFFYSNEEDRMHVHVEREKMEVKVWLDTFEVASNYGFRKHELLVIKTIVRKHEKALKKAWTAHFN